MRSRKQKIAVGLTCACLLALVAALWFDQLRQPVYDGKRVGQWFRDLSIVTPTTYERADRRRREREARLTFEQMNSNAVPFLRKQFRTPDSRLLEASITWGRNVPIARVICNELPLPAQRRYYALRAFTLMGTNANSAIPALIDALEHEFNTNSAERIVVALGRASGYDLFIADSDEQISRKTEAALGLGGNGSVTFREDYDPRDYDRELVLNYVRSQHPEYFATSLPK